MKPHERALPIAEIFAQSDAQRLTFRNGDFEISLSRSSAAPSSTGADAPTPLSAESSSSSNHVATSARPTGASASATSVPGLSGSAGSSGSSSPQQSSRRESPLYPADRLVVSDLVGIVRFHKAPPKEGFMVDGNRELASIESLGVRNPVLSGGSGRIERVLVTDGEAVEFGRPLFVIERV